MPAPYTSNPNAPLRDLLTRQQLLTLFAQMWEEFGLDADPDGNRWWADEVISSGKTENNMIQAIKESAEYKRKHPMDVTEASAIVDELFQGLGIRPTGISFNWWRDQLTTGAWTQAGVRAYFASTDGQRTIFGDYRGLPGNFTAAGLQKLYAIFPELNPNPPAAGGGNTAQPPTENLPPGPGGNTTPPPTGSGSTVFGIPVGYLVGGLAVAAVLFLSDD